MIDLDVIRLTPPEAAAFHRLRQLDSSHLREIALAWLEQGLEASDLAILASERDPIMSDVAPLFERVLRAFGVDPAPIEADAVQAVERVLLRQIVADDTNTAGKVWELLSILFYGRLSSPDEERYLSLLSLFYSTEDERMSAKEIERFEQQMREEAFRLLSTHNDAS